jgi:YidC/Oxa1 family membrane protein insertase
MQQHYFLSAWIPIDQQLTNRFYSQVTNLDGGFKVYTIGFFGPQLTTAPGATGSAGSTLYVGPEIASTLKPIAPGLDRTIDYGWLWWISIILFWLMESIHKLVGNWGWSIVITTIIIKFVLYPLSATSFRSMAKMREMQPKLQQLKERFGDDRQALSRATMELYRKEKINPLGGCLPMLIQIPVFIGLYYVIIESVQLRQAPFILWIHDLSVKDPYYVLPILMGFSMVLQQRLTPSSPDPAQAKMMMIIPLVFTVFFLNFPAGLTLYWLVNNCVQILQQWYVTKTFEAHKEKKARKAKAKKKKKNSLVKK